MPFSPPGPTRPATARRLSRRSHHYTVHRLEPNRRPTIPACGRTILSRTVEERHRESTRFIPPAHRFDRSFDPRGRLPGPAPRIRHFVSRAAAPWWGATPRTCQSSGADDGTARLNSWQQTSGGSGHPHESSSSRPRASMPAVPTWATNTRLEPSATQRLPPPTTVLQGVRSKLGLPGPGYGGV